MLSNCQIDKQYSVEPRFDMTGEGGFYVSQGVIDDIWS